VPLDSVIDFKREVYQLALTELARFIFSRTEPGWVIAPLTVPTLEG
jgi:hypothetical protein